MEEEARYFDTAVSLSFDSDDAKQAGAPVLGKDCLFWSNAMSSWATSTLVFVRDVDASIGFYVDKIGFTLNMRHAEAGRALVAGVSRGDGCALLLTNQWPDRIGLGIIYAAFGKEEFDALRAELQARDVTLKDGWWGKQVLIVKDFDGNQLYFVYP